MSKFIAYFKVSLKSNTTYRIHFLFGFIGNVIQVFIYCAIWKALYGGNEQIDGITYTMVTTNFILSLSLNTVFSINDSAIQKKLSDGSIAMELLKPIDLRVALLADDLGEIVFNILTNLIPSIIFASLFIGMLAPKNALYFLFYLISMILGFLVLWSISTIVQMSAFWIVNVWSISTIKKVLINVLSGIMLPLWFFPTALSKAIAFTPFETIYHIPMSIYLGNISISQIAMAYLKQIIWFIILFLLGSIMWNKGKKKVFVQGG